MIEISERTLGPTLEIESEVFFLKLPGTLATSYGEISNLAAGQNIELLGMPFARYVDIDWAAQARRNALGMMWHLLTNKIHFWSGRFVAGPAAAAGDARPFLYAARPYLLTHHIGSYAAIDKTYKRLMAHASENGLTLGPESFEHYIDDPTTTPKDKLRTEVLIPLAGAD